MRIRNPAFRYQEEEECEGSSASDKSRLLSLSSEIALTDGLALALGEFTEIFPPSIVLFIGIRV
jgi:hypothetical protein